MDLDYQHKYLKYKKKYLDLKYREYSGGGFFYFFYSKEKKTAFNAVKINGLELEKYKDFQNDKDVVLEAVKKDGLALQYASTELKNNNEVGLAACFQNSEAKKYLSNNLFTSPQFKKELNRKIEIRYYIELKKREDRKKYGNS